MSRHERGFRRICVCRDCDGTGYIEVGRRGANDPDTREVECPECEGVGEMMVASIDEDEEA